MIVDADRLIAALKARLDEAQAEALGHARAVAEIGDGLPTSGRRLPEAPEAFAGLLVASARAEAYRIALAELGRLLVDQATDVGQVPAGTR